jgi:hypothetical protein
MPKSTPGAQLTAAIQTAVEQARGAPLTAAQIDFLECMIPALMAALPAFLDAFMRCIAGGSSAYDPGDRPRCP